MSVKTETFFSDVTRNFDNAARYLNYPDGLLEQRDPGEVLRVSGRDEFGQAQVVAIAPHGAHAVNFAFDVTPARLVTGLVTERGVTRPAAEWLAAMFPEHARRSAP